MSMKHLGETFDIHGGGKDLVFPHHENEIAQSEAATGKPFARYWLHNGFVNINNEKMSKSLGNFFTLRDVLAQVKPEVLRFFLASSHYRSPIDYSDQSLTEAKAGLDRLYRVKEKAEACRAAGAAPSPLPSGEEVAPLLSAPSRFGEAMDDDFNTAAALGHLFDAVRALNRLTPAEPSVEREKAGMFLAGYELLDPLFAVLGLLRTDAKEYFQERLNFTHVGGISGEITISDAVRVKIISRITEDEIERRIEARRSARAAKQYAEADRIRKELEAAGVLLEDGKGGTTWKYKE
jgi:cysteinyl-tRNA synthetase